MYGFKEGQLIRLSQKSFFANLASSAKCNAKKEVDPHRGTERVDKNLVEKWLKIWLLLLAFQYMMISISKYKGVDVFLRAHKFPVLS